MEWIHTISAVDGFGNLSTVTLKFKREPKVKIVIDKDFSENSDYLVGRVNANDLKSFRVNGRSITLKLSEQAGYFKFEIPRNSPLVKYVDTVVFTAETFGEEPMILEHHLSHSTELTGASQNESDIYPVPWEECSTSQRKYFFCLLSLVDISNLFLEIRKGNMEYLDYVIKGKDLQVIYPTFSGKRVRGAWKGNGEIAYAYHDLDPEPSHVTLGWLYQFYRPDAQLMFMILGSDDTIQFDGNTRY